VEESTLADQNPKIAMLRRVPLFANCRGGSMDLIGRLADEVDVPDGYALMRQGDLGHEFVMIVEGQVRVERDGALVNRLGPGDYVGEIALLDEGRRTATAVTEGPAKILVISHQGFQSLLDSSTEIRQAVMESLVARVRQHEPDAS
jgi:CRP-like cAMP-binding protein